MRRFIIHKKYCSTEACLDFNGFNTEGLCEAGVSLKPKSRVIYQPLIDKTPSDPSAIQNPQSAHAHSGRNNI